MVGDAWWAQEGESVASGEGVGYRGKGKPERPVRGGGTIARRIRGSTTGR